MMNTELDILVMIADFEPVGTCYLEWSENTYVFRSLGAAIAFAKKYNITKETHNASIVQFV